MVVTAISIVKSKRSITTIGKIVLVSIGQSELFATGVVAIVADESPLAGILAFDPGYIVLGAFEGAGGEFGGAGDDGGHGLFGEGEAGDGEDGGEFHGCWRGVWVGWSW